MEEARKALERIRIPEELHLGEWKLEYEEPYKIEFNTEEDYNRTKAMIDFCTNYEPELFQQFYKWFKTERKED